jgi:hypothetical protein
VSKRIGWGEFYHPETVGYDYGEAVRWHARLQFVEAIEAFFSLRGVIFDDIYPQFILLIQDILSLASGERTVFIPNNWLAKDALKTILTWQAIEERIGPLPPIRELALEERADNKHSNLDEFMDHIKNNSENEWDGHLFLLVRGIQRWAKMCNLCDQTWFCEMVIIMFWRKALKDKEDWALPSKYILDALFIAPSKGLDNDKYQEAEVAATRLRNETQISFNTRHWNPLTETIAAAEKRITSAFIKQLRQELKEKKKLCQTAGFKKTPEKRNQEHFKWLVYYQMEKWSLRQIADWCEENGKLVGEDTISKAIHSVAELIGLPLRPPNKG